MKSKIYIVNSNASNIFSLYNAIKYLGHKVEITSDDKKILSDSKIIFPGVGSYEYVSKSLKKKKIIQYFKR